MSETTAPTETNVAPTKKASFRFKKGTRLMLGSDEIILTEDARLAFDGADNEQQVVGMLLHSKNLELNREQLKGGYNGFGQMTHTPEEMKEIRASEAAAAKEEAAKSKTK